MLSKKRKLLKRNNLNIYNIYNIYNFLYKIDLNLNNKIVYYLNNDYFKKETDYSR